MAGARRTSPGTARARWAGALLLTATALLAGPAAAAPTDVVVAPLTAADGDPVAVSGGGCTGPVDVVLRVPDGAGTGTVVADQDTVAPAGDGTWSTSLTMQGGAALVLATCDGVDAPAVVVGDGSSGRDLAYGTVRDGGAVEVSTDGLDDGSTVLLVTPDGRVVAEGTGTPGGALTLTVPGPGNQVLVLLGTVAGVPVTELVRTPTGATFEAAPPVTTTGGAVLVSGQGCAAGGPGTASVVVSGESANWYDAPAGVLDVDVPAAADGSWQVPFTMPAESVRVQVACTVDPADPPTVLDVLTVVGALDDPTETRTTVRVGDDAEVDGLPVAARAFALDGSELAVLDRPYPQADLVLDAPDAFVVTGWVDHGENADPDVVADGTPVTWRYDVAPAAVEPPPAVDPPAAPVRGGTGAELADTGWPAAAPTGLALLLLAAGAACTAISRRVTVGG